MFRIVFISLLVGMMGVGVLFFVQKPAIQKNSLLETLAPAEATTHQKSVKNSSILTQFQNVRWNTLAPEIKSDTQVFQIFSPLIKPLTTPLSIPALTTTKQFTVRLPKNILAISPLGSLAQFMTGAAAGANTSTAGLTGVNSLGSAHITNNHGIATSWFGSGLDFNGLTENIPNSGTVQEMIARGGNGLAMPHNQFLALPDNFRLSANDPLVQSHVTSQGLQPGDIGLLNPQAPYAAIPDSSVPTGTKIIVTDDVTGYQEVVIKVDAGPGTSTGKGIDLSPGSYQRLGNGDHPVSYALASDQSVSPGPTDGSTIPYDKPVIGLNSGGSFSGGGSSRGQGGTGNGESASSGGDTSYCGDDYWSDKDPMCCYKHTGPAGGPNQYDGVKTCNAGWYMSGGRHPVPIYVPNCGTNGGICDRALSISISGLTLSCLFTACAPGKNAIWDPQTLRCGCDDGMGGNMFADTGGSDSTDSTDSENPENNTGPNGTPGKPGTMAEKVTLIKPNDAAGFPTGAIVRSDGTIVPVDQHLYDDLQKLSENGMDVTVTSMVGNHDQFVSGSNTESRHWTGHAMDIANNEAATKYLYDNRVTLGIHQIISGAYPWYNYDSQGRTFSDSLLRQHDNHVHIGH